MNKEIKHFLQPFCSTVHDHRTHKLLNRMACTIPHVTQTNQSVCLVNDLGGNFPAASRGYFAIFVVGRTDNERKKNVTLHYVQRAKDAIAKYFVGE